MPDAVEPTFKTHEAEVERDREGRVERTFEAEAEAGGGVEWSGVKDVGTVGFGALHSWCGAITVPYTSA